MRGTREQEQAASQPCVASFPGAGHEDWPLDSCACHIFYEHWVRMQLVISQVRPDRSEA